MTPIIFVVAANLFYGSVMAAPDASLISHKVTQLAKKLGVVGLWRFERLSRIKQVLFAVWILEAEVYNGGLSQYFYNSSGRMAPHVSEILKSIGAEKAALIVEEAIQAVGPNIPWNDDAKRYPIIKGMSKEVSERLDDLDRQFSDQSDEMMLLLFHYLSQRRDQIDVPTDFWTEVTLQ